MTQFTVEIEHIKGEAFHETMRRVQRTLVDEGRRKGIKKAGYTRKINDIVNALRDSESPQYVTIVEGRNGGRLSRRSPKASIPLAIKSPVKELDNYIQDSLPDAIYGKMLNLTPRELALQESLKTQVGISSKLRVPHMEPEERLLAANIIGSLPTGGYGIEESAKKQLSATVKQALGDLGIDTASNKGRLLERLQAKPFFNDPTLIANFSNMIRAYHDVRENNLHYMQSIITGMPKTKDAELLTNSILPTPDNILNGSTAYLIFDTGQSLNIEDLSSFIDAFVRKLLNYEDDLRALKASDKQQQIGRFLAAFDFDRGAAAQALEEATLKAIKTGGDFIDSYLAEIDKATIGDNSLLKDALSANISYDDRLDADSEPLKLASDVDAADKKKLVKWMVDNSLAFPIKPTAKKLEDDLFLLIPLQLPSFENIPIGWDRRWMIATMKIVDEYWPMIYGEDRKVLLSDLLYLIAARAKELFNYDIDVVQMTILALLLTDTRSARRRERPRPYHPGVPILFSGENNQTDRDWARQIAQDRANMLNKELWMYYMPPKSFRGDGRWMATASKPSPQPGVPGVPFTGGPLNLELIKPSRGARRKARSILPKAEKGEALRSLRTLLRESTYDEPENESATDATRKLMLELVKIKQDEKAKDDDDARAKKRASGNFQELVNYLGTAMDKLIGQSFGNRDIIKIDGTDKSIEDHAADYNTDIKAKLKEMLDAAGDEDFEWFSELKGLGDMVKDIRTLIEKYKELSPEIQKVAEGYAIDLITSDPNMLGINHNTIKKIAKELGISLETTDDTGATKNRDYSEIQADLYNLGRGARSRRLLRNPPSGRVGHVTAEVVMGVNILKDIAAFGRDLVGGRSKTIEKKIKQTQKLLIEELHKKGEAMGGNALRNIRIEPFTYGSSNSVIVLLGSADVHNESGSKKKAKANPPASCPLATQDLKVNTKNRDSAIKASHIQYGPLNLNDNDYWVRYGKKWNTTPEVAKESNCSNCLAFDISPRMKDCMPGDTYDKDGELGYCWMHHFKCHSARTCYTWAADGPIDLDSVSLDFQKRAESAFKNPPEFTPDYAEFDSRTLASTHAQGKFVDANTRQPAPIGYVVFMWEHSPGKYRVSDQYEQLPEEDKRNILTENSKVTAFMMTKQGVKRGKYRQLFLFYDDETMTANPPKNERKYKGVIIKKVEGGWNVEAYDKTLPTLAKAREFISSKVKGSAKPNQRCIRIISGIQCKGTVVKMNKGPHYRCKDCGAKYKAV